jgi:hypothetical protein
MACLSSRTHARSCRSSRLAGVPPASRRRWSRGRSPAPAPAGRYPARHAAHRLLRRRRQAARLLSRRQPITATPAPKISHGTSTSRSAAVNLRLPCLSSSVPIGSSQDTAAERTAHEAAVMTAWRRNWRSWARLRSDRRPDAASRAPAASVRPSARRQLKFGHARVEAGRPRVHARPAAVPPVRRAAE